MLYRNKVTNEVADMIVANYPLIVTIQDPIPSSGMLIFISKDSRFYWTTKLNPPTLCVVHPDEFDQWELTNPSRDLPFDREFYDKVLPREVDIRVDRSDIIRVIGDATIIIRKSDDEQGAS